MFLTLTVIGLVGLALMAIPTLGRRGHGHLGHARGVGHVSTALGHGSQAAGHALTTAGRALQAGQVAPIHPDDAPSGWMRFVPSPRVIFSILALYGAFGNALVEAAQLPLSVSVFAAAVPALAVERLLVTRLWNLLIRFQGKESSPLEMLLFAEARAVVPFRNGRGVVAVHRDGRLVQLSARLREDQAQQPVKVGDRLSIEDIDPRRERVTVSVIREPPH